MAKWQKKPQKRTNNREGRVRLGNSETMEIYVYKKLYCRRYARAQGDYKRDKLVTFEKYKYLKVE